MTLAAGIDVGSSTTKVVLVRIDGSGPRTLAVRSAPTPTDADVLRATALRLLGAVLEVGTPQCVGVASMAETGVPLDRAGLALTPLLRWNADLDDSDAAALAERAGRRTLFTATGVRPAPKVPLALWAGLRRRRPDLPPWRWAGAADLVVLALTGRLLTDHTLAGRTMAYRLPESGAPLPDGFDAELLDLADLSPARLPEVQRPGDPPARATGAGGLTVGTPVLVAGHDHQVGGWAAGVRTPGDRADSLGTAESVIRVLGSAGVARPDVQDAGMSVVRTVGGDREALVAGSAAAGSALRWWLDTVVPADRWAQALAVPPADPDLLVLPYLSGRQSPYPAPQARFEILAATGAVLDPATVDPVTGAGAVFHAVARQARWMMQVQDELAGGPAAAAPVVVGGSGPLMPAWLAAKAAVQPGPTGRVAEPEPVAAGAALLAAVRSGLADPAVVFDRQVLAAAPAPDREERFAAFVATARRRSVR